MGNCWLPTPLARSAVIDSSRTGEQDRTCQSKTTNYRPSLSSVEILIYLTHSKSLLPGCGGNSC